LKGIDWFVSKRIDDLPLLNLIFPLSKKKIIGAAAVLFPDSWHIERLICYSITYSSEAKPTPKASLTCSDIPETKPISYRFRSGYVLGSTRAWLGKQNARLDWVNLLILTLRPTARKRDDRLMKESITGSVGKKEGKTRRAEITLRGIKSTLRSRN